jgi:hypothetical protein
MTCPGEGGTGPACDDGICDCGETMPRCPAMSHIHGLRCDREPDHPGSHIHYASDVKTTWGN